MSNKYYNCYSLKSIDFSKNKGFSSFGSRCFSGCKNLTSITLPDYDGVLSLGEECFNGCSSLEVINLPESTYYLGRGCFSGCPLTSITLPSFIRTIEDHCFENCQNLLKVTCKWESFEEIYSIGKYIFENIPSEAKLYVPKGTKNLYQSTEPWSNFKYIIEENSGTSSEMKKCETPTINYEYKKLTFTSGTEGAQFYYTIKDEDVKTDAFTDNGVVNLVAAYSIKAYASADGFENSDVAEAMLYFINAEIETTNINTIEQRGVLVTSDGQNITINGLNDGEQVTLYNLQGVMLSNDKASLGRVTLGTRGEKGVVILKTNSQTIKINLNK